MTRADPLVVGVLVDLAQGLRMLGVEFCVIGALVPEFLLETPPRRTTKDADVTVLVQTLDDFERVKLGLTPFGFTATRQPHRLTHRDGGWVDLLPYSRALAPGGHLVDAPRHDVEPDWFRSTRPERTPGFHFSWRHGTGGAAPALRTSETGGVR